MLLLVVGCSGPSATVAPSLPEAFPNHTPEQIRARIAQPTDSLQRFSAKARVTLRSPQQNGTFNASIKQVRAGSLYMSLSLFGIEGARVLVTSDSAFFYDRRQQRVMEGTVQEAQSMLPVPITSNAAFENLLGLLAPAASRAWSVTADSTLYFVTDPSGQRTFTIDPTRWRVVRYARTNAAGETVEERLFSQHTIIDGVDIPQQVVFRRPKDDVMAVIRYRSFNLSPSDLSFALNASPSARRVGIPSL